MRRLQMGLAAVLIAGWMATGSCAKKERPVIAVVPKGQAHVFWQAVHAGAVAAGRDLGVDILWNGPASEIDFSRQIGIVDDFINRRVDGLVLAPAHGESLVPVVERANAEGIPVVILDSGIQTDRYVSYVSTDNYKGGATAAERMIEILPRGGNVAVLATIPGSVSTGEREKGFQETLVRKAPHIRIAALQYGMSDRARSLAVAEDILTANPDLAAIFCSNESGTIGTVQGAKSKGVAGKLKIVGFDSSPTVIEDLEAGLIDSLVVQNPFRMGYLGVESAVRALRGSPPDRRIDTGATLVTRANLKEPSIQELLRPPIEKYLP